ncbi:hypothetical protein GE09DRAFT_1142161 [Coniochaeta sp. 2T2.1]|nr:hypothetical protein GE09DRAFT_1142161 [Coniochaeta sp. 2T2.1]
MKAKFLNMAVVATFLLLSPALAALHLIYLISVEEYLERRTAGPEREIPLFGMDAEQHGHIKTWQKRLLDLSTPPVGPCRLSPWESICLPPPYPLFPVVPDTWRNPVILRSPPDVVREYIEKATDGELSTVDELVGKALANLGDLSVLRDNEITLLATNFRWFKTELTFQIGCGPRWYEGGWSEDLLISEDEQRALLAGFLHAIGDEGYIARQHAALQRHIQRRFEPDMRKDIVQQCKAVTQSGAALFQARVAKLDLEVLLSEEEWLARYDEYVAALRAELYAMLPRGSWDFGSLRPALEKIISMAEDMVEERMDANIPKEEPGFCRFLEMEQGDSLSKFPGLRHGVARRLMYWRWKTLAPEIQANYVPEKIWEGT